MFNKKVLKEMFDFTTNRKRTFKIGIIIILASLPYLIFYQYVLSKVIDNYIPDKNIKMVWILSLILIAIIIIRFFFDKYSEIQRKACYYDNDLQIKIKYLIPYKMQI